MKIFRTLILVIFIAGLIGSTSAQNKNRIGRRVEQLKEALKLTNEQSAKITEIMIRYENQAKEEQKTKPFNKKSLLKNEHTRMMAMDKEIEPLLTQEQLKKYESYKKQRQNEMKSRMKGRKFKED